MPLIIFAIVAERVFSGLLKFLCRRDDRVDEVARAMSVLTDHVGVSSSSSVIRSFRAVKSAKEAEFPAMGDPVQRFAHSAASNEDDVIRRWNQYVSRLLKLKSVCYVIIYEILRCTVQCQA